MFAQGVCSNASIAIIHNRLFIMPQPDMSVILRKTPSQAKLVIYLFVLEMQYKYI